VQVPARSAAAAAELRALGPQVVVVEGADCTIAADCTRMVQASTAPLTHVISTMGGVEASSVGSVELMKAVQHMKAVSLERFVLMTSLGCGETWDHLSPRAQKFLHDELKAKDVAERHLKSCGLPYCIVRPGGLKAATHRPTGTAVLVAGNPRASGSLTRRDLAHLTLQCLHHPRLHNATCSAIDPGATSTSSPSQRSGAVVSYTYDPALPPPPASDSPSGPGQTGDHDTDSAERPTFEVLSRDQEAGLEIRRYPALIVAETTSQPRMKGKGAFMRLAAFIGVGAQPQNHSPHSEEEPISIPMTSPVLAPSDSSSMLFVMPSHFTADSLPVPTDPTVSVRTIPAAVYAVRTFSGWAPETEMAAQATELEAALEHSRPRGLGDGLPLRLKVSQNG
jgi:hypothetical protein